MTNKYRMPAEWEDHSQTLIAWPVKANMAYPEEYEQISGNYYASLVKDISDFEPVTVVANPSDKGLLEKWQAKFNPSAKHPLNIIYIDHDDAWIRDTGPTLLTNDEDSENLLGVNWNFNGWGELHTPWQLDQELGSKLLAHYKIDECETDIVLEGGAIHTDGQGTLLVTEESLLDPGRNPKLTRDQMEAKLKDYLQVDKVIWLPRGLDGDETKGHIDNLACFIGPAKVMIQVCDDPEDPNYERSHEALAILEAETDALGRKLEIIKLPSPPARYHKGKRLALSYINFYFVNGGIIIPIFGGPALDVDGQAMRIFHQTFPDRQLRAIKGILIAPEGGNVHCTTYPMF